VAQEYGLMQVTFSSGSTRKVLVPREKYLQLRESLFEASSMGTTMWFWVVDEDGRELMIQSQHVAMIEYESASSSQC